MQASALNSKLPLVFQPYLDLDGWVPNRDTFFKGVSMGVSMGLAACSLHVVPKVALLARDLLASAAVTENVTSLSCVAVGGLFVGGMAYRTWSKAYECEAALKQTQVKGKRNRIPLRHLKNRRQSAIATSKMTQFFKDMSESGGLVCIHMMRTELAHRLTSGLPAGNELFPQALIHMINTIFKSNITLLKRFFGANESRLELFKNFGSPLYCYDIFMRGGIEEGVFRGILQTVLLNKIPKAIFPQHQNLLDSRIAQVFRVVLTTFLFALSHDSQMDASGVIIARFIGDLLPSIYREYGMSLAQLTFIHSLHNSLYLSYDFALPATIQELNESIRLCKILQSRFSEGANMMSLCQGTVEQAEFSKTCSLVTEQCIKLFIEGSKLGCPDLNKW